MTPPESTRFCLACGENTIWKYNRMVGHSRCTKCGGIFSVSGEITEEEKEKLVKKLMPWIL